MAVSRLLTFISEFPLSRLTAGYFILLSRLPTADYRLPIVSAPLL